MSAKTREVKMGSKEEVQNNWVVNDPKDWETQAMRRIIHQNKPFLRKGGLLIIKVDWDIIFEVSFFMGYRFKLEQKFSVKQSMKIRVKFYPQDCVQKYERI